MSLPRFAVGGALGGLLLAGVVELAAGPGPDLVLASTVFALAGAVSAAGTLAIARKGEKRDLVEGGPDRSDLLGSERSKTPAANQRS